MKSEMKKTNSILSCNNVKDKKLHLNSILAASMDGCVYCVDTLLNEFNNNNNQNKNNNSNNNNNQNNNNNNNSHNNYVNNYVNHVHKTSDGTVTILICASMMNHLDLVKYLVYKKKADLKIKDNFEKNALDVAIENDSYNVIPILNGGYDDYVKNEENELISVLKQFNINGLFPGNEEINTRKKVLELSDEKLLSLVINNIQISRLSEFKESLKKSLIYKPCQPDPTIELDLNENKMKTLSNSNYNHAFESELNQLPLTTQLSFLTAVNSIIKSYCKRKNIDNNSAKIFYEKIENEHFRDKDTAFDLSIAAIKLCIIYFDYF